MVKGGWVARLVRDQGQSWSSARAAARRLEMNGRTLLVGCGTSYYLAQTVATMGRALGLDTYAAPAGEAAMQPGMYFPGVDRLVIISRSGTTTEALWVQEEAARQGIPTVGVTCQETSPLAVQADQALVSPEGEDDTVVMIRSFTSMLVLLQTSVGVPEVDLAPYTKPILDQADQAIHRWRSVPRRVYLLGGGIRYGLVNEGALKIQEMSGQAAYAYAPLEFRHGPRGSVTTEDLVVLLGQACLARYEYGVLEDIARQGPSIWVVAQEPWWSSVGEASVVAHQVRLPDTVPDLASGPLAIIPLQQIAWEMAIANGRDPDHPDNLEKVVAFRRE